MAESLLKSGVHTAEVVSGYQKALDLTLEILPSLVIKRVQNIRCGVWCIVHGVLSMVYCV